MRIACLLFHDVVESDLWDSSGFTTPGAAKYKLGRRQFEAHLAAVARVCEASPVIAHDLLDVRSTQFPTLLTFDDGGSSAATLVADLLAEINWRAHFFVTAGQIGKDGFMDADQIRDLRRRGHVIGSHSYSHPSRMSHCDDKTLNYEWSRSVDILSEVLGESVDTASVPGGHYSKRVAETAAAAGIRILFNSEPTTKVHRIGSCIILGRFSIVRGTRTTTSGNLVSKYGYARLGQSVFWSAKKIAKIIAGQHYVAIRRHLLR